VLESQQTVGFRDIVTGDESWFLQRYHHRQIWCISVNEIPTRVTYTIELTSGEKFNSGHFCEKYPSRFPKSRAAGALQSPQDR
jgi:hypothetical protein